MFRKSKNFFHTTINFDYLNVDVLPLWFFYNNDSEINNILRITKYLTNNEFIDEHVNNWNQQKWLSCFGVQCFIKHDFLVKLNNKYSITNLINVIKSRNDRCALERIFGILFFMETKRKTSLLGIINHSHKGALNCDYTFDKYYDNFLFKKIPAKIIKVWTGR